MKLRTKILVAIFIAWSFIFLAVYAGSQIILKKSYLNLEEEFANQNFKRVYEVINQIIRKTATVLKSYAVWDSTYTFVQDRNKKYFDQNLTAPVIAANDFDLMAFYDAFGHPFVQVALNKDRTEITQFPSDLAKAISPGHSLWKLVDHPSLNKTFEGLFLTQRGILILSSHPVLNSRGQGPIYATLLAGKYFTDQTLEKIRKNTKLEMTFYPLSFVNQNAQLKTYYKALMHQTTLNLKQSNVIVGYRFLKDMNGNVLGLIEVKIPRVLYLTGAKTIETFNLTFLISGIILALWLFYLLRRLLLKPLEALNKKIVEVGLTRNFALVFPEKGKDEIASVGVEANKTLGVIREYDAQNKVLIGKVNHELDQANTFLKEVQIAQALLKDIIDSMPSELVIVDRNTQVKVFNQAVLKNENRTSEEVKEKPLLELFLYLKPFEEKIKRAIKTQFSDKIQRLTYKKPSGELFYSNVLIFPVGQSYENDAAIRIDNISDQVKLEEKMLQNEKFAFIGILTSGFSYEINRPIDAVIVAIDPLKKKIKQLLEIVNSYLNSQNKKETIQKPIIFEELTQSNLTQLGFEIKQLLNEIKHEALTTAELVKQLRHFSRLDEAVKRKNNMHKGMDEALNLLYPSYKHRIQIIKTYGKIPLIYCYSGKLNQAFMQLLKILMDSPQCTEIKIKTEQIDPQHIAIFMQNNGLSISTDPTNQVSIRSIIEMHGGTLLVKSEPGKGTTFIMTISID